MEHTNETRKVPPVEGSVTLNYGEPDEDTTDDPDGTGNSQGNKKVSSPIRSGLRQTFLGEYKEYRPIVEYISRARGEATSDK